MRVRTCLVLLVGLLACGCGKTKSTDELIGDLKSAVQVDPPELTGDMAALRRELAGSLATAGLYPKEAQAMLDKDGGIARGVRFAAFHFLDQRKLGK